MTWPATLPRDIRREFALAQRRARYGPGPRETDPPVTYDRPGDAGGVCPQARRRIVGVR